MKRIMFVTMCIISTAAVAQATLQPGYLRSDGTYVAPAYRSAPDSSRINNLNSENSIYGGVNPYTGKKGTQHDELSSPPVYNKTAPLYSPYTAPKKSCVWPSSC